MDEKVITRFLKENIEPIDSYIYGKSYRAAVYLKDGTYLPCVIFRSAGPLINFAIKRFKEEKNRRGLFKSAAGYYQVVKSFVIQGNRLNYYEIDRIEESKYVFPAQLHKQITGETTMGWTGFTAKMKDGKYFAFGTSLYIDFFQFPEGYQGSDVAEIINHSYVSVNGSVQLHKVAFHELTHDYDKSLIHRERQFFECFLDNL